MERRRYSSSSTTAPCSPSSSSTTAPCSPSSSSTTAPCSPSSSSTTAPCSPSSSSTTAPCSPSISLIDKFLNSNSESSTLKPPRVPSSIMSSEDLSQSLPETSQSPSSTYSVAFFQLFSSSPSSTHSSNLTSSSFKSYTTNLMPTHLPSRSSITFSSTAVLSEYPPWWNNFFLKKASPSA